jgi:hypothetical protein
MCATCTLLRLNVNVCGVVIEDGEVLHPELPEEVAEALVAYAAGVARLRTVVRVGDSRKTGRNVGSHTSVLTRVRRTKYTLCFHTLVVPHGTETCG